MKPTPKMFRSPCPDFSRLEAARNERHQHLFGTDQKGKGYRAVLDALPDIIPSVKDLNRDRVRVGSARDINPQDLNRLMDALKALKPWRKGPFEIFGIDLDSEWDSSLKWNRVKDHISDLSGRRVLDIGSSSGYYLFRMAALEPALVLGIEPYLTFYCQFLALQHYINAPQIVCLPVKLEEMPLMAGCFDTVFCMGILYHRRSPLDTLVEIRKQMRKGGELVLETLIMPGDSETALFPEGRYAKMNNIFFLPTVKCLSNWLSRTGFHHIRCIDVTRTTLLEQRKTEWIQSESLDAFLNPRDPHKTIEGYPAPVRAVMIANARF